MDVSKRNVGININEEGLAGIVVWAPFAQNLQLKLEKSGKRIVLEKSSYGYWQQLTTDVKEGDQYKFVIDGTLELPDPASVNQPEGVHGPSAVFDLKRFDWSDNNWKNIPLGQYMLYELHTGTFSTEGTFDGIGNHLKHLIELGINAIEIMPISQFPGNRNWGYDGVFPFAVQESYGGAQALMELVNLCHSLGLAVVLDVVYNHLGPEGNYLGEYGPYFTDKYKTPWGGAINFDDEWCDGVRNFFLENALMWFRDFHIDALRLDAVHAIRDFSAMHILEEMRLKVNELMKETGRVHYLIVELDLNDTRFIKPRDEAGYGMDGQWIDEFHHALRVTAGGDRNGYYSDFKGIEHLAKAYTDAYVYDGQFSEYRKKKFGIKAEGRPGEQFIVFSQNHDQVGNRMLGERTSQLTSFEMQKLLAVAVIMSPFLPMLFMGEEWSESNPFQYFVSHTDPVLAEAVRKGRKEEFAAFHMSGEAPDPVSEQTFNNSKLSWHLLDKEPNRTMFEFYRTVISLRKRHPTLRAPNRKNLSVHFNESKNTLILDRWNNQDRVMILMNFSDIQQAITPDSQIKNWVLLLNSADRAWKGPAVPSENLNVQIDSSIVIQPESCLIYSTTHV